MSKHRITAGVLVESESEALALGQAITACLDAGTVSTGPKDDDGLFRLFIREIPEDIVEDAESVLDDDDRVASYAIEEEPKRSVKITITLEIEEYEGDGDAMTVVDAVLDSGVLQEAINSHETDAGEVEVTSAVATYAPDEPSPRSGAGLDPETARMLGEPPGRPT